MIRFSVCASLLRRRAVTFSMLIAGFVHVSAASALDLDFNVPSGNYNVANNWIDQGDPVAVPPVAPAPPATPPTVADRAWVRNGGTLNISSADVDVNTGIAATNYEMRIGYHNIITAPDYDGNGVVDASDYVLWRKGGPLLNDLTPATVGPEDYTLWRLAYGTVGTQANLGRSGALNWTAGEITGEGPIGGNPYSGGPDIRIGRIENVNGVPVEVVGTAVQNGPTTKLILPSSSNGNPRTSKLIIGDGTVSVNNPQSSYTLADGEINVGVSSSSITGTRGNNADQGITVRNGTFNMTGGKIGDATHPDFLTNGVTAQRILTIASATGAGLGNETVGTANISGGIIDALGGFRLASSNHTRGYLNISGTANIKTGGDTTVGANASGNAVGEINMSGGTFQVGRTDFFQPSGTPITGRLIVGDTGRGTLNMTGGSINATNNVVVGNHPGAAGSVLNLKGGTITTPGLEMRRNNTIVDSPVGDYAAKFIVDGPTATFTTTGQSGSGLSPGVIIGNYGKALFEVRQGTATLGGGGTTINVGLSAGSQATVNVTGGKLILAGPVSRTVNPIVDPVFNASGGILEWNNPTTAATQTFHADFNNTGAELITRPNAVLRINLGQASSSIPADFSMSGGIWNIDIGSHSVSGADWFSIPNGTTSLTGGELKINYLSGFTPNEDEVFTILDGIGTPTLGAVTISGPGSPFWKLKLTGNDIQLEYDAIPDGSGSGLDLGSSNVPEPTSLALVALALLGMFSTQRTRRAR